MNKSNTIGKLTAALSKARAEFGPIRKDSVNPHFKSKFSSLDAILEAIIKPLSDNGVFISQHPIYIKEVECVGVITHISHSSDEWMESEYLLPIGNRKDAQASGSCLTYARRYALQSVLCIAAETDEDGNAASKPKTKTATVPAKPKELTFDDRKLKMIEAYKEFQITVVNIQKWCGVSKREEITQEMFGALAKVYTKIKEDENNKSIIISGNYEVEAWN